MSRPGFLASKRFNPFDLTSLRGWTLSTQGKTNYKITSDGRLLKNGVDKGRIRLIAGLEQRETLLLAQKFHTDQVDLPQLVGTLKQQGQLPAEGLCLVALTIVESSDGLHFIRRLSSPIVSVNKG